jgi:hypothetical protein
MLPIRPVRLFCLLCLVVASVLLPDLPDPVARAIAAHNQHPNQTWKMGTNAYAHLPWTTFFRPREIRVEPVSPEPTPFTFRPRTERPDQWDWRTQPDALGPVQDQGACGSCWAFAAQDVLAFWARGPDGSPDLSKQQLLDCSTAQGNRGCRGGWPARALVYAQRQKPPRVCTTTGYPYLARQQRTCNRCPVNATVAVPRFRIGWVRSETELLDAVLQAPVAVAVRASPSFQYYASGIFNAADCNVRTVNHAMVLVGYGTTVDGTPYWILRNSWGDSWGEAGYMRIRRGVKQCHLGRTSSPVLL